jgi:GNAT superfamily N-acetyltransferase
LIKLREAGKKDNEALLELQKRCPQGTSVIFGFDRSPDFFNRSKSYEKTSTIVAEEDGVILGAGSYALRKTLIGGLPCQALFEFGFLVDPIHRRKGVATLIQNEIESYAEVEGVDILHLTTVEENTPSMRLFEKAGFEYVRTLHRAVVIASTKHDFVCNGRIRSMEKGDVEEVVGLLNSLYNGYEFYLPFTKKSFLDHVERIAFFDLSDISILEENGQIQASIGRWPLDKVMRTTILQQPKDLEEGFRSVAPNLMSRLYEPLKMDFAMMLSYRDESSLNLMVKNALNGCVKNDSFLFGFYLDPDDPARKLIDSYPHIPGDQRLYVKPLKGNSYPTLKKGKWYVEAYDL